MTRLFIRFYIGVLVVLFLAWYIHGHVISSRWKMDRQRVILTAHSGGARLVAEELDAAASSEDRENVLERLRKRFDYHLEIFPLANVPDPAKSQFQSGDKVAYDRDRVIAILADGENVVRLGAFPNYELQQIEASLAGWMRLTKERLESVPLDERDRALKRLQAQFAIPVELASLRDLPAGPRERVSASADEVAFYSPDVASPHRWFSVIQLSDESSVVRFGPFPNFQDITQQAAPRTLALVLLPAALAIALLLRPVARQLRELEDAAEAIAQGELGTRVDSKKMNSAKSLAQAFNHMAGRTEKLVRTQRELLQAVSHELRTPLSRIRFAIDLIESADTDEERRMRLESLDNSTEELDALVGELLSYVRMETADKPQEVHEIFLGEAIESLLPKYSAIYPDIEFQSELATNSELSIYADPRSFQRAIGNLVNNAGRHASTLVRLRFSASNGMGIIDVDDDGPGIPEQDRHRVFEPFVRLPTNESSRGVGLGLALVQRIAEQNGAEVEIRSSPSGGCRVQTRWPTRPVG